MGIRDIDPSELPGGPSLARAVELVPRLISDDPLTVGLYLREQYGHTVRIPPIHPSLDKEVYLVSHPDDLQYILQSNPSEFGGLDVPGSRDFSRVIRNSIVSLHEDSEEGSWTRRMRLVGPEFNENAVIPKAPEMVETTLATLAEFEGDDGGATAAAPETVPDAVQVMAPDHDGVRLLPAMQRLTLRLLGVSLFGPDIRAQETDIIESVDGLRDLFKQRQTRLVASYVGRRLPDELHLPGWLQDGLGADPYVELGSRQERQIEAYVDQLIGAATAIVERRLRTPRAYDDALGAWLCRQDPVDGESLDPETLRQEVLGLLIAGHATVTAGMTWALYLLAARPEVQERIRAEARETELLAPHGEAACQVALGETPATEDGETFIDSLPYTRRVWEETLRLYPSLPVFGRTTKTGTSVGGEEIDAGTHVLISPYVTHRDPEFWDDPDTFDPSRFEPEQVADRHEFAYLPFSKGRHSCLGENIATTEATAALAAICATYRIEFARPHDTDPDEFDPHEAPEVGLDSAINLQPDRDIHVRFVPMDIE
jgi:cytochrome P450